jgi:transposase-like protein
MSIKNAKARKKNAHYRWSFKRKVIMEYLKKGKGTTDLSSQYGVSPRLINIWVNKYVGDFHGPKVFNFKGMTEEERQNYERLKLQNEALQKELEFTQMKVKAMEILIDLAKTELGVDVRKNFGAKQSAKPKNNTHRPQSK